MSKQQGNRQQGRVKWFNDTKGFGFIKAEDESDVFVHYSQINASGHRSLEEDQEVSFLLKEGPKGLFAEDVTVIK